MHAPPPPSPLQLGMIGLGRWGRRLANAFAASERTELRWLCDLDPNRLAALEPASPPVRARRTTSHQNLIADPEVDAVVIATPPASHAPLALAALTAQKHVFVEKPMATSLAAADELVAAVAESGCQLMVGHILTFHPGHAALSRLVAEGAIGRVHSVVCQRWSPRFGRPPDDAWWSLAVHDVSLLGRLMKTDFESIGATGDRVPGSTCYGRVRAELGYAGGARAILEASTVDERKLRRILVAGERGVLSFDELRPDRGVLLHAGIAPASLDAEPALGFEAIERATPLGVHPFSNADPLALEVEHFAACLTGRSAPESDVRDGWRTVRTLEAAMGATQERTESFSAA